jgi:hypothetical protein
MERLWRDGHRKELQKLERLLGYPIHLKSMGTVRQGQ